MMKHFLSIVLFALASAALTAPSPAAVQTFMGINNRTLDGWADVQAYVGSTLVHSFCVGPGKSRQEGVSGHILTHVRVDVSRGAGCKGKPIDMTRDLPLHTISGTHVGALGFLDGDRGSYTVKDRL